MLYEVITGEPVFEVLRNVMGEDLDRAEGLAPALRDQGHALYVLPDAAWSRRIHGHFGNRVTNADPARASAILVKKTGRNNFV